MKFVVELISNFPEGVDTFGKISTYKFCNILIVGGRQTSFRDYLSVCVDVDLKCKPPSFISVCTIDDVKPHKVHHMDPLQDILDRLLNLCINRYIKRTKSRTHTSPFPFVLPNEDVINRDLHPIAN